MGLLPIPQGIIVLDIGQWLPVQPQGLGSVDRRGRWGLTIGQPMQHVENVGLGRDTCL